MSVFSCLLCFTMFHYVIREDLWKMFPFIECLFIELSLQGSKSILIGCIYRPPNSDLVKFNLEIDLILSMMKVKKGQLVCIMGDFNIDLLKLTTEKPTQLFLNNMISHSMFPCIRNPTRITDNSATLIDNIFLNAINYEFSSAIVYSDISDHYPVIVYLKMNTRHNMNTRPDYKRSYTPETIIAFNTLLSNTDWSLVYKAINDSKDPSQAYDIFLNIYKAACESSFPEKLVNKSNKMTPQHEWITKGLMRSCIKKSKLYQMFCQNKTDCNKMRYAVYRNKFKTLLRKAEVTYYSEKFKSVVGDIKETWKVIGQVLKNKPKTSMPEFFVSNGIKIESKQKIINHINDYFINIGNQLALKIPKTSKSYSDYLNSPNPN